MPAIRECIVTTIDAGGNPHIAPLGLHEAAGYLIVAPFRPSRTLENLSAVPRAVANYTDDVRLFAGCVTGRRDYALTGSASDVPRLQNVLAHDELEVVQFEDNPQRPRFTCRIVRQEIHAAFTGFNRAKSAVVEAAILVSRLHMLPRDKIEREVDYLRIAVEKTAGDAEQEAWGWLMERIDAHQAASS